MRGERQGIGTGILLILVGLLFMADRQGLVSFARLWPLLIVAAGVNTLLFGSDCEPVAGDERSERRSRGRRRSRASGGIWLIFVGGLLLADQNRWLSFRDSWPLFIVAGGLALIAGSISRRSAVVDTRGGMPGSGDANTNHMGNDTTGGGQWQR